VELQGAELIEWLNSFEGRAWSRNYHRQQAYQTHLFTIKEDDETIGGWTWEVKSYGGYDIAGRFRRNLRVK
jgi:hypothetical protein